MSAYVLRVLERSLLVPRAKKNAKCLLTRTQRLSIIWTSLPSKEPTMHLDTDTATGIISSIVYVVGATLQWLFKRFFASNRKR